MFLVAITKRQDTERLLLSYSYNGNTLFVYVISLLRKNWPVRSQMYRSCLHTERKRERERERVRERERERETSTHSERE